MNRLYSKTGCLTCVTRKKKCDEFQPICTNCQRLGLDCAPREAAKSTRVAPISTTNMKRKPTLRPAISNGYPAFRSEIEKFITLKSPSVLQSHISPFASRGFKNLRLLGRFCTQNMLVRDAVVAFAVCTQAADNGGNSKIALKSYLNCIDGLKQSPLQTYECPDQTLTAILFLGLLEGLGLGNPRNTIVHFEMCRILLVSQLSKSTSNRNSGLLSLYRIAAECIMFNFATLSPLCEDIKSIATDWGTSFDSIFSSSDETSSPFFGGFHDIYRIMFQIRLLQDDANKSERSDALYDQLCEMETKIINDFSVKSDDVGAKYLYSAKYKLHIYALRIYLTKITYPRIAISDSRIQVDFQRALLVLNSQDIREPGNPALRWPLTILACAAFTAKDFNFVVSRMREVAHTVDPANSNELNSTCDVLQRLRSSTPQLAQPSDDEIQCEGSQLEYMLNPWEFDAQDSTD